MRKPALVFVVASVLIPIALPAQRLSASQPGPAFPAFPATPATLGGANLPFQPIGASDLVRLTVYDAPELSQSFRIDPQGNLNLPLLHNPIHAAGLLPEQLRDQVAAALRAQHLLVNPVVDVSV